MLFFSSKEIFKVLCFFLYVSASILCRKRSPRRRVQRPAPSAVLASHWSRRPPGLPLLYKCFPVSLAPRFPRLSHDTAGGQPQPSSTPPEENSPARVRPLAGSGPRVRPVAVATLQGSSRFHGDALCFSFFSLLRWNPPPPLPDCEETGGWEGPRHHIWTFPGSQGANDSGARNTGAG